MLKFLLFVLPSFTTHTWKKHIDTYEIIYIKIHIFKKECDDKKKEWTVNRNDKLKTTHTHITYRKKML